MASINGFELKNVERVDSIELDGRQGDLYLDGEKVLSWWHDNNITDSAISSYNRGYHGNMSGVEWEPGIDELSVIDAAETAMKDIRNEKLDGIESIILGLESLNSVEKEWSDIKNSVGCCFTFAVWNCVNSHTLSGVNRYDLDILISMGNRDEKSIIKDFEETYGESVSMLINKESDFDINLNMLTHEKDKEELEH